MISDNNKISTRQSFIFTAMYFFCSGVVLMPVFCLEGTGVSGCLASLAVSFILALPMFMLSAGATEKMILDENKFICRVLRIAFAIKNIVCSVLFIKLFSDTARIFLLPKTPLWITSAVMLGICMYAAASGIETLGRLSEILIFLIGIPFFAVFAIACFSIKYDNITEMAAIYLPSLGKNTVVSFFAFASFDPVIFHISFCAERKAAAKNTVRAAIGGSLTATAALLISAACFGEYAASKQTALIPEIMNIIKLPSVLIERHDLFNMFFWILILFCLITVVVFFAMSLSGSLPATNRKMKPLIICLCIFLLTFLPINVKNVYILLGIVNAFANVLTFLLLGYILLAGRRKKNV